MQVTLTVRVPKKFAEVITDKQIAFLLKRAIEHDRFWQRQYKYHGRDRLFTRTRISVQR